MLLFSLLLGALLPLSAHAALQLPLNDPDADIAEDFTTLSHKAWPNHSIRIKAHDASGGGTFGDPTVRSYSGYLEVGAGDRHLFFTFYESRSNPDQDGVIMWINGGPGCSSSLGNFMELGPMRVVQDADLENSNGTTWNPWAWNSNANLFFLDSPIGVGFSYSEHGQHVGRTEEAAVDAAAFISIFFETFSQFKSRAFTMAGESYGGRYLPVFAAEVVDQNRELVKKGLTPINLTNVLIGNGITDSIHQLTSSYDMMCKPNAISANGTGLAPIADVKTCVKLQASIPRCEAWLDRECVNHFDRIGCEAAMSWCSDVFDEPLFTAERNPYNLEEHCILDEDLCYPITRSIRAYLDQPALRKELGVPKALGPFKSCSNRIGREFNGNFDRAAPTQLYVAQLLERGINVHLYVGTLDWICNWVGNLRWASMLEWSGKEAFNAQPLREWSVEGRVAGLTRSANGFTFSTINGAGHMVPWDQPEAGLAMLQRTLAGKPL